MTSPLAKPANLPYVPGSIPNGFTKATDWYTYVSKPFGDALDRLVGDTDWWTPDLFLYSDWSAYGDPYGTPGYRKSNDTVRLGGLVKSGSTAATNPIFVLPLRYRPRQNQVFTCVAGNGVARVVVQTNGVVYVAGYNDGGNNSFVSLDPIRFPAATT